ncbi:MAG: hydantoinase/oxoprolinase family protein, partial [Acidobacteriales bacterium]|nr:hydantoinase/oxoprolinase family protein [Terriglobales bacterium]
MSNSQLFVSADIGGTFTDFVVMDEASGAVTIEKTPTTRDIVSGILDGLGKLKLDLNHARYMVHGTTVALNTFLQRSGAKTGLITTKGFRDVYEIGRHSRTDLYNLFFRKPVPLVPRRLRLEVTERLDYKGEIVTPLDLNELKQACRILVEQKVEALAICFLHSYVNPEHEFKAASWIRENYPGLPVSTSAELVREWREYERTSTSVINAYVLPVVKDYIERLSDALDKRNYKHRIFVNRSSGGVMSAERASIGPVHTIMSGPAGGTIAAAHVGALHNYERVIAIDAGGTSFDVSLIIEGKPQVTSESKLDGHPILVPVINIHSIGAGGGSIASVDEGGALSVGPRSAGATPGPACYAKGGMEATVTDAHMVCGALDPNYFLGGEMRLDPKAAEAAVRKHVADRLGLPLLEAAHGIIKVANTNMATAIREMTIQKGFDPREFVLVAFGGAGPMHANALADDLEVAETIIPVAAGAFSALGILLSNVRFDSTNTKVSPLAQTTKSQIQEVFKDLEGAATENLTQEGFKTSDISFSRELDMRYVGQEYTVRVPVSELDTTLIKKRFDEIHEAT